MHGMDAAWLPAPLCTTAQVVASHSNPPPRAHRALLHPPVQSIPVPAIPSPFTQYTHLPPPRPSPSPSSLPLASLMMGTRAGDMDPAVPLFLQQRLGADPRSMDTLLNKKSGLLGVCGDNDLRSVIARRVRVGEGGRDGGGLGAWAPVRVGSWTCRQSHMVIGAVKGSLVKVGQKGPGRQH